MKILSRDSTQTIMTVYKYTYTTPRLKSSSLQSTAKKIPVAVITALFVNIFLDKAGTSLDSGFPPSTQILPQRLSIYYH